jgi:glycosidase
MVSIMPAFIDNHDMDRFIYIAEGNKEAHFAALERLMRLPNPPVILYGTELGLTQTVSTQQAGLDASRPAMPCGDEQDLNLLEKQKH